jgi:hypothetical protein
MQTCKIFYKYTAFISNNYQQAKFNFMDGANSFY